MIPSTVVERRRRVERGATTRRQVTPATFEESTYRERVTAALRAIDGGVVDKVVVACAAEVGRGDPVSTLELLSQGAGGCRVFGTSNGDWTFVGATPEPLLTLEGDVVKTCALAGTSGLGDDGLAASEKDLREHRWVVDSIRRSLSPHCARLDIPASPGIKRLSTIQHLHTPISGRIHDGTHPRELVAALHPTPAVCGSPREPAAKLVDELEPFDRGLYAGVLGWVGGGWADLGVAIRSALFLHDRTILYAGAGIVAGSDPRREAVEVREKLRSIAQWVRLV